MKIQIECSEKELYLINRALEVYGRIGLLQFEYMDMVDSLNTLISNKNINQQFDEKARELKSLFGYPQNAGPGVFNTDKVSDDVREALNIHQIIRNELWKQQEKRSQYTVDAYPADICRIANMKEPDFKLKIEK